MVFSIFKRFCILVGCHLFLSCNTGDPAASSLSGVSAASPVNVTAKNKFGTLKITSAEPIRADRETELKIAFTGVDDVVARLQQVMEHEKGSGGGDSRIETFITTSFPTGVEWADGDHISHGFLNLEDKQRGAGNSNSDSSEIQVDPTEDAYGFTLQYLVTAAQDFPLNISMGTKTFMHAFTDDNGGIPMITVYPNSEEDTQAEDRGEMETITAGNAHSQVEVRIPKPLLVGKQQEMQITFIARTDSDEATWQVHFPSDLGSVLEKGIESSSLYVHKDKMELDSADATTYSVTANSLSEKQSFIVNFEIKPRGEGTFNLPVTLEADGDRSDLSGLTITAVSGEVHPDPTPTPTPIP